MLYLGDWTFILLMPALILAIYAQAKVQSTYRKYSAIPAGIGKPAWVVAREMLDRSGLTHVPVDMVPGELTDHYDPRSRILRLSSEVYNSRSIAAIGIAAHEVGHAIQHATGYLPLSLRNAIVPVANIGSQLAIPFFLLGFIFGIPSLMDVGIIAFSGAVLFQLITLPVEFNASSRAVKVLYSSGYVSGREVRAIEEVLGAAALTYIAATAMAALQLVRLLILRGERE
ncbi:MAG: zinc metallopeptidase [Synergistetes bacterium]|nr:zinc metallopeptidase [Synergistota bacterium]MCX8127870.1 zinc metallopeptidase [Synergistota bacterium]MDW8192132.1 zinc metallopeptidase [Synergistota bacterium]